MLIFLTIIQYFAFAATDVLDKFLITARKIEPVSYTFYTIFTGLALLVLWPWVFQSISIHAIGVDVFSGLWFSLAMYIFFIALSQGEVSRVIPFVFGLIPVFDIITSLITGQSPVTQQEIFAMWLLIPGAFLIAYHPREKLAKHITIKIVAAMLLSSYNFWWHYASAHGGAVLNHLMWNRIGAALGVSLFLLIPIYRKAILKNQHVEKKHQTSAIFVLKQGIGGAAFIMQSYLYSIGSISVVSALQGFRYVFVFIAALIGGKKFQTILDEKVDRHIINRKLTALTLILLGTIILFV